MPDLTIDNSSLTYGLLVTTVCTNSSHAL